VTRRGFGTLPDGRGVEAVTLTDGTLSATILNWGAVLNDLRLAGVPHGLTLGSPVLSSYLDGMGYYGAIVGPVANRIGGATARIDGRPVSFPANENGSLLHGGEAGCHAQLWKIAAADATSVTLRLGLADGLGGFPGNRLVTARYSLPEPGTLALVIEAETDAPTLFNFAQHGYWNLDGTETYAGHRLQIHAESWLPVDDRTLPTGEIAPVAGSAFDFRAARMLTPGAGPRIDHNFCLARSARRAPPGGGAHRCGRRPAGNRHDRAGAAGLRRGQRRRGRLSGP
jgi:aldose 1-epimerase